MKGEDCGLWVFAIPPPSASAHLGIWPPGGAGRPRPPLQTLGLRLRVQPA